MPLHVHPPLFIWSWQILYIHPYYLHLDIFVGINSSQPFLFFSHYFISCEWSYRLNTFKKILLYGSGVFALKSLILHAGSKNGEADNLLGFQKGSREDAATYLLIWYLVIWHVTQHNRTISARITDTRANRWCPGLASSPSRCTFTSAGRPSCPCRGPWRWNSVGKTEFNMRQWQSEAMLKTSHTNAMHCG